MINHSRGLDLEITDFEYHRDPTPSGELLPSQTNNISEGRCELKSNEPVSERSERASGCIVGYISKETSGELLVCPQYCIILF